MVYLRSFLLPALLAPVSMAPALAQAAGQVLWTVDIDGYATMSQPRVAPDGTIYVVTNQLYAISPAGEVLWTAPAWESYVDLGADGTIYTAGANTVFAYRPDGSLEWSFTESPGGQGIMQGPTVGPDGNLYVISDLGGLGAFSLTPAGEFRWNVPGFSNNAGTGLGRVQFGPDNLYFAESWVPGCGPLTSGLGSVTLGGELDWCIPISGPSRPWATLDGRAITWQGGLSGKTLLTFDDDGALDWTYTFAWSPVAIGSVVVGPDNHVYAFHANNVLASLTADGSLRWEEPQPINNFPWRAAVAPDLSALVSGSVYGFGNNGTVIAADPANGKTLWTLPVTGPSAGAGAPAEFAPDGSVVYVPVNTLEFGVPDQLWAIQVRDMDAGSVLCLGDGSAGRCPCGNVSASRSEAGCAHSGGVGATLRRAGSTSVSLDDLVLTLGALPQDQPGLLFRSSSQAAPAFLGDGLRCLAGPLYRFPAKGQSGGTIAYGPGLVATTQSLAPILHGSTWLFQGWFRDPAGPCSSGSNLTNGLALTFTP